VKTVTFCQLSLGRGQVHSLDLRTAEGVTLEEEADLKKENVYLH
jgi:hypothetical protein